MPRKLRIPSYRHHKPSGQARVTLNGRDFFLGKWNTDESKRRYEQLIAEWLENCRELPEPVNASESGEYDGMTIVEVIVRYLKFANQYYRKNGKTTNELSCIKPALSELRQLYGRSLAKDFGPKKLKTVRQLFVANGLARNTANKYVSQIQRCFKWACSEELIPSHLHHSLMSVQHLQKGRTEARETEAIQPVDHKTVERTIELLGPVVADIVRLQRVGAMRPQQLSLRAQRKEFLSAA